MITSDVRRLMLNYYLNRNNLDIKTHPLDLIVGANLRRHRENAGITLPALARGVGISYQQLQKYETGRNRISMTRAWEFALLLNISVEELLTGAPLPRRGALKHGVGFVEKGLSDIAGDSNAGLPIAALDIVQALRIASL